MKPTAPRPKAPQLSEDQLEQIRKNQRKQTVIALAQNFITAHLQGGRSITPAEVDYYFRMAQTFLDKADSIE